MDQVKIGKFIAECRKKQNLTQSQLAEILNITDRAVSKWERGKSLPDASIMIELCNILKITVTDLLNGEIVSMSEKSEKTEKVLLELIKEKEQTDKRLLSLEIVIIAVGLVYYIGLLFISGFLPMKEWLQIVINIVGVIPLFVCCLIAIRIEQIAGYYECKECKNKYVPSFKDVSFSPHMGRTRYLKCPKCGKRSWNKKVVSKE